MIIKTSTFVKSSPKISDCPQDGKPEYAFIGRSNVGKSSLINSIVKNGSLAKTSSTPGKTQLINHFEINSEWYIVDLPGLGFAKVPKPMRAQWEKMIFEYLSKRRNLLNTFILIDSRIEPQKIDLDLINWFGENQIPFTLVFTKSDKLSKTKVSANVEMFKLKLAETWEELPEYIISSSTKGVGQAEILNIIEGTNNMYFSELR